MIAYLHGVLHSSESQQLTLLCNGVGYLVLVPERIRQNYNIGDEISLYTHLIVREDSHSLYGFDNKNEQVLFQILITVNGVGPKAALAILSTVSVSNIVAAVRSENDKVFTAVSGIGPKTAKMIIVSLSNKLDKFYSDISSSQNKTEHQYSNNLEPSNEQQRQRILSALQSLGWRENQAIEVINAVIDDEIVEDSVIIRKALVMLGAKK